MNEGWLGGCPVPLQRSVGELIYRRLIAAWHRHRRPTQTFFGVPWFYATSQRVSVQMRGGGRGQSRSVISHISKFHATMDPSFLSTSMRQKLWLGNEEGRRQEKICIYICVSEGNPVLPGVVTVNLTVIGDPLGGPSVLITGGLSTGLTPWPLSLLWKSPAALSRLSTTVSR